MTTMMAVTTAECEVLADALCVLEQERITAMGYKHPPERWHVKERTKFFALDCGGSGAFLIEKATGELYNIKGYGVADYNKKKKADLGNIATVDAMVLHGKRWNYLR